MNVVVNRESGISILTPEIPHLTPVIHGRISMTPGIRQMMDLVSGKSLMTRVTGGNLGITRGNFVYDRLKLWCVLAVLATVIAVGVVNMGLLLSIYVNYSQRAELRQQDHFVCVSCQRLQQTFSRDVQLSSSISRLSREMRDGVETCCAVNPDQMAIVLELIRRRQAIERAPVTYGPANVTSGPVSVHRCFLPPPSYSTTSDHGQGFPDSNLRLRLDSSGDDFMMEHAQSVKVLPSGFLVLVSGFYHVYSSLEFMTQDSKPCKDYPVRTWKQIVVRSRPNDRLHSGAILSSAHTCCDDCIWVKETSYTGGTFYLQAGDHLHTEVSGMGLISFHAKSSYFGLMAI